MKPIKVLSLFDGISCGLVALDRANIPVSEYHTSEIDKFAIKVSDKHFGQRTTKRGSVTELSVLGEHFDLLIGGSPCQGFSKAGFEKGFEDSRSKLFWEYVRILKECRNTNPNIRFLLENVKMKQEWLDIISEALGCFPVLINSSKVSAQLRNRVYWANWKITEPENKNIKLLDILESDASGRKQWVDREKSLCITAHYHDRREDLLLKRYKTGMMGDQIVFIENDRRCRCLSPIECERLQTLPDNYTDVLSKSKRYIVLGNCWTVDVIAHIFRELKKEYDS